MPLQDCGWIGAELLRERRIASQRSRKGGQLLPKRNAQLSIHGATVPKQVGRHA
jgi:hypothetical protein